MNNKKTTVISSGTPFISLLTLAFIVLKLCNVITWSWWWVLSPMLFSIGLGIIFIIGIVIASFIIDGKRKG